MQPPQSWTRDIEPLLTAPQLNERISEMGREITETFRDSPELVAVGILKGCFLFYADLVRHIDLPIKCEFIGISSYADATTSSGVVKISSDLKYSIEDKDVLIIEDIIDTGLTMSYLLNNFSTRKPRSLNVCTLLDKPERRVVPVPIEYTGFTIPDRFVVGYGLDLAGRYRNLPHIGVYHGET